MKTSSLDILESSALPTPQAHAILKVLEQEMTAYQENLATKSDLFAMKAELKAELATRAEMNTRFDGMATKAEMNARFDAVATKAELYALEGRLSSMILRCFFGGVGLLAGAVYFLYAHPGR